MLYLAFLVIVCLGDVMKGRVRSIFNQHTEAFERILLALWNNPIEIEKTIACPQEKEFFELKYQLVGGKVIDLKSLVTFDKKKRVCRVSLVYKQYPTKSSTEEEKYMVMSLLYHCKYDLELCNQYGLYHQEDADRMEETENVEEMDEIRNDKNLLNQNQFYIFNMDRIEDGCADKLLEGALVNINEVIKLIDTRV